MRRLITKMTAPITVTPSSIRGGQPPTGNGIVAQTGLEATAKAIIHLIINK